MTLCDRCGFDNPPGMRFCGNCGARLPEAGSPAAPPAPAPEFSPEALGILMGADLMERMRRAGLEASGQRRSVTVLFTDLTGYTALSQTLDEEILFDTVQQYIQLLSKSVYKFEGSVDKITGDGLMALFGAPISYENNAERAVRAALDMQADIAQFSREMKARRGFELNMRVGLHAGTVIVGGVGSNMMMNYTAIGDTVNLARRIEEAAPPGAILVSEAVYRQTRPLFDFQQVSVLSLKGISRPVIAFRVMGEKAKPGPVRGLEGLHAPLIGREQELGELKSAAASLPGAKQGDFFMITGEAGIGKSRLTAEFKASLERLPVQVLEGQSLAYRRSIPYWIFLDTFYHYLGLSHTTPAMEARERLVQKLYQALGAQAAEALPYFEHLLSLPYSDPQAQERLSYLDAKQLRQQIFLAVRDLLLAEAQRRPLVLILDDLHWADEASLELLHFLVDAVRQAPLFILGISREVLPGAMARSAEWAGQQLGARFHRIQLGGLSIEQSERLLFQLLTIPSLPAPFREQILQRAAGVPFYLEEILRMLIDQGVIRREAGRWELVPGADTATLGVPETLQELILARFDRLEPAERRILQVASVIGKDFNLPVLSRVLGDLPTSQVDGLLGALAERQFIQPQAGLAPAEFTFRHILMSDAIYGTILRRERSVMHGQVGEAIESLYADRLESQIELLANHYRYSPRLDRALHYCILAGEKATRSNVNEQARQHFEAALEILPQVAASPAQVLQVQQGMADVLVIFGDYPAARQHYQVALEAIAGLDRGLYAEEFSGLFRKLAKTYERQGDYDQALADLDQAQQALSLSPRPLPVESAEVLNGIGWIHFRRANFADAKQMFAAALDLTSDSEAYNVIAATYNRLGGVAYNQGEWDVAAGYLRKSIAIRESIHDYSGLAGSFSNLGFLAIEMGEFDNALENLTRSYELYSRLGQPEGIAVVLNNLGWLRMQRGELDESRQALEQALQLALQIGYPSLGCQVRKTLGELYLNMQDPQQATQTLGEIIPTLVDLSSNDHLLDTYRLLGEAALEAGDLPGACDWEQKALALVQGLNNEEEEVSAVQRGEFRRFRGALAIGRKDWEAAGRALQDSEAIFKKLRSRLYQGRIAFQYGALAQAQGDRREAQMHYREAALLFQSVGARLEEKRAINARNQVLS